MKIEIKFELNGKSYKTDVRPDEMLLETLRSAGCLSVKCGCETTNCGLCTVFIEDEPRLSCAYPSPRANGKKIVTLEGLPMIAEELGEFIAGHGAEQCGFCNPGFIMNIIAMEREFNLQKVNQYLQKMTFAVTWSAIFVAVRVSESQLRELWLF